MKRVFLVVSALALTGAAMAATAASCIDPHKSYVARPLNNRDVFVRQSIGTAKPPVRLQTSCIDIHAALGFGISSSFNCVGLGDTVVATINGGRRESCRVTKVLPYAPQDGDIKQP